MEGGISMGTELTLIVSGTSTSFRGATCMVPLNPGEKRMRYEV